MGILKYVRITHTQAHNMYVCMHCTDTVDAHCYVHCDNWHNCAALLNAVTQATTTNSHIQYQYTVHAYRDKYVRVHVNMACVKEC